MGNYILKRIMSIIPVFLLAALLTTGMIHLSPVDPAEAYLAAPHIQPTDEILAQKRHEFGLDQPFFIQYVNSVLKICQLDFGISYVSNQPVWDEVAHRMPATVELALGSLLIAVLVSVPLGFLAGIKRNGAVDHISRFISFFGASIPTFWLGYMLVFFFSVQLDLFPVEGAGTWRHLVLPSMTLALPLIAMYTRSLPCKRHRKPAGTICSICTHKRNSEVEHYGQTCIANGHFSDDYGSGNESWQAAYRHNYC